MTGNLRQPQPTGIGIVSIALWVVASFFMRAPGLAYDVSRHLRNVPVSEITLAEPLVARANLMKKIPELRNDSSKRQELAGALAELSLLSANGKHSTQPLVLAKQAAKLVNPSDRNSHVYFLTRRALCFALDDDGLDGLELLKPLLNEGLSELDLAQLYDDLAARGGSDCKYGNPSDCALKAVELRVRATGAHSLEVAESLRTLANPVLTPAPIDSALCQQLQLPELAQFTKDSIESIEPRYFPPQTAKAREALDKRKNLCLSRAAQIQESILGGESECLADTLSQMGAKEQKRAIDIYKNLYGPNCIQVVSLTHRPSADSMPDFSDRKIKSANYCFALDVPKLSIPGFSKWLALIGTDLNTGAVYNHLSIVGCGHPGKDEFRMDFPAWTAIGSGKDNISPVDVVGPGKIRFHQNSPTLGRKELVYKWTGKSFELIEGKPGPHDAEAVREAIDDAVDGLPCYGLRGHHAVNHDLIKNALEKADSSAAKIFRNGDPFGAAARLRMMFNLTLDLVQEASTGVPVKHEVGESILDDTAWIRAWSYAGSCAKVNLQPKEYSAILQRYAQYCQKAGTNN